MALGESPLHLRQHLLWWDGGPGNHKLLRSSKFGEIPLDHSDIAELEDTNSTLGQLAAAPGAIEECEFEIGHRYGQWYTRETDSGSQV